MNQDPEGSLRAVGIFIFFLPFRGKSDNIKEQIAPMCDDICASVTISKRLQTLGEVAASVLASNRGGHFCLCGDAQFIQLMGSNVLTMEPFDSNTTGEKGDGAEAGGILQLSIPRAGDPYFGGVCGRGTLRDMNMNWFQRITFVRPEIGPIRANLKNLRHCQSLHPWQTEGSDGRRNESHHCSARVVGLSMMCCTPGKCCGAFRH